MKKINLICVTLLLAFLLVACGKQKKDTLEIKKQVWTQDMLNKINNNGDFNPNNPQKNGVVIVGNSETQVRENGDVTTEKIQEQGQSLLGLIDELHNLQAISSPRDDTTFFTFEKLLKEDGLENLELQNVENPNDAKIKLEYKVSFVNAGKFNSATKLVDVYNSQMEITAIDMTNGNKISSVIVKNSAGSDVKFPEDVGDTYWMDYPDLTSKNNSKLLFDFFINIVSEKE